EKKRPLMQRLSGDRVFKECYETGHYCFNLWGKLFDTRLLKKAFDLVEEIPLPFGQDKYEYFIISHLARSYRGIARKLYHYSAGNGISTMEEMDLRSFRRICTISEVADTAEHYAQSCGDPHVQDAVFDFRYQAVQDCISKAAFLQGGVWAGLETLLSRFSMPLVCAAIAQMYRGTEKNLIAAMEAPVEDFSANRRIRTVAAFYPSLRSGGAQRVTAALTRVWQEAGYRVILFTEESGSAEDYSIPDDVTRVLLPKVHAEDDTSGYERARLLQQSLCDQEVDLMVYHDWFGRNLLLDLMVCKLCRIHFVIHCHNYFSRISLVDPDRFENMLYIYTLADGVVTLSDTDTAFWKQFHDTVFQTVNPMQFRTVEEIPQSPCDGYTVIWCQRISPEKNPMAALEVFGLVHDQLPDARMLLLGEAKDPAWDELIRSYLADRGLTDAVTCLGYRKNVEAYYRKASVCIMTSEVEGFPLGLMESMGAGVPVVMYALPYLTIVEKGKGILSVRKHDTHSMAREVIGLLTDDARRKQLGREARESIAEILRIDLPGRWTGFFERIESEPHIPRPIPILWQTMLEKRDYIGRNIMWHFHCKENKRFNSPSDENIVDYLKCEKRVEDRL
ncbi:MAG: glycosyltransferase family 4 protein, partial [Lachnospiraceae bacterium]|nr:glycosyltransferase family 4 protein [Lachnospiraceae bacterium]